MTSTFEKETKQMAKSIEPDVKDWFARTMTANQTEYKIEQNAINSDIEQALKSAPSKNDGKGGNRPDFQMLVITKDMKQYPVMIEAKGIKGKLIKADENGSIINQTKEGKPYFQNISGYAVNGAVHYANAVIQHSSVYHAAIAVGINGYKDSSGDYTYETGIYYISKDNLCIPKKIGDDLSLLYTANKEILIQRIQDSVLTDAEREALAKASENLIETNLKELNQLMHDDLNISVGMRVELIAGMIMAGLGVEHKVAPLELSKLEGQTGRNTHDGQVILRNIEDFLTDKELPEDKRNMIITDLQRVFTNSGLYSPINGESKLRKVYAHVKSNIIPFIEPSKSTHLDFTGKLFNVLTEWVDIPDGGKNDVVLTPRYVTDLMAKLCRVDRNSYVWDYAVGTAGFLVSSMKLMLKDAETISDITERERTKAHIKYAQLLGVEKRPDIYLLAVLNMILMGDGTTNILQADSLTQFDGNYGQGDLKGKPFPATVFLLNPPYSAEGKGFIFAEKAMARMTHGKAAILIQENAGSGSGLPFTKNILKHSTLLASIHMADIFRGKAGVQTAIYVFEIGKPHDADNEVIFINMSNDGYTRQNRKKASQSTNLRDTDHAFERYAEVADIVLRKKKKTDYYQEGKEVIRDTITLEGNDWTFNQHRKYDTVPTEEDFKRTVASYLAWETSLQMNSSVCNSMSQIFLEAIKERPNE